MPTLANTQIIALLKSGETVEDVARNLDLPLTEVAAVAGAAGVVAKKKEFSLREFALAHQEDLAQTMLMLAGSSENDAVRMHSAKYLLEEANGRNNKHSVQVVLGQNIASINERLAKFKSLPNARGDDAIIEISTSPSPFSSVNVEE